VFEMLMSPTTVLGLGDGGAHTASIVDSATPTHMLAYWVRDRPGPRMPIEFAVKKMTLDTASLYGLNDRGVLAPGKKADVNLIDAERIQLEPPDVWFDLPSGAPRLVQGARGYVGTFVSGIQTFTDGKPTGERPGVLLRGMR
jgi:N-acyl-D-aspartate/D-glutamate deacylase